MKQHSAGGLALSFVALAAALASFSCTEDAGIRISGQLLLPDGTPAAGVMLYFGTTFADVPDVQQGATDASGKFEFVTHAHAIAAVGELYAHVSASTADGLLAVSVSTYGDDVTVPPIRMWSAQATVTEDVSGGFKISWPGLPQETPPTYQVKLYQGEPGSSYAFMWASDPSSEESYVVPPEVIEDRFVSLQVVGGDVSGCSHRVGMTSICVIQQTNFMTMPLGTALPISRGAACTSGSGGLETPLLTLGGPPCPLTDGLIQTGTPTCQMGECPEDVVVDLGVVTQIRAIVVHGVSMDNPAASGTALAFETSSDGTSFTEAGRFTIELFGPTFKMLALPQPTLARKVRLRAENFHLQSVTELAVF